MAVVVMTTGLTVPVQGTVEASPSELWFQGFDRDGAYTDTKNAPYRFVVDRSALVYGKEVDLEYERANKEIYAGSALYVPIGSLFDNGEGPATDKQIKADKVEVSYKALAGADYIEDVTLVSAKKEKLKGLPTGMYAKIQFTNNYLPITKSKVSVRLVLSVNGISYQHTAVTFRSYLQNRVELVTRNSVYGALSPAQFHAVGYSGEATFDFGNSIRYTTRVQERKRYYLNLDRAVDPALTEMYPKAYLESYNFLGNNDKFAAMGPLEIPIKTSKFVPQNTSSESEKSRKSTRSRNSSSEEEKDQKAKPEVYIYTFKGNTLRAVSLSVASYDPKTETITIKTDTLDNYVFSSLPLLKKVEDEEYDILRSGYADGQANVLDNVDEPEQPSAAGNK